MLAGGADSACAGFAFDQPAADTCLLSQVGPTEAGGVFEPVPQQAIDADVIDPDEREGDESVGAEQPPEQSQSDGDGVGVECVVDARAAAGAGKVARKGEVGREPQGRKQPPAGTGACVEDRGYHS